MEKTKKATENMPFSAPLHAFRGFAILFIVAVHSWAVPIFINANAKTDPGIKWVNTLNEVLFHDSTLFFTLISGVLFSIILQSRGWKTFFQRKLLNVVLPYVVVTLGYSLFVWGFDSVAFTQLGLLDYVQLSLSNILLGKGLFHLWYLPILVLLFLSTPLLVFIKDQSNLAWMFWLIVLAPLFVSRAWPDFSWMTVVYFMGAYSLGIYVGANYQKAKTFIDNHVASFVVLTIVATITLIGLFHFEVKNIAWIAPKESIFYVQKLCLAALVLWLFERSISTVPRWLDVLANYAFPIYLVHGVLLYASIFLLREIGGVNFDAMRIVVAGLANLVLILILSTLFIAGFKRILGRKSRMLIGA
jgi:surface polysaccharide O-acyltransferase-like enzyme